ncbi:hypothetical protein BT69DRAFT_1363627 [Atractiella rhizophila]|nr:hypothetical protein BT69DRAFT_1363627 [Atractiella rhizophila]
MHFGEWRERCFNTTRPPQLFRSLQHKYSWIGNEKVCAKAEDAGSSHIRSIFQKDVEELKIAGEELSAFRKDFENDADFLKGEYNSAATVNWSRTRPAVRRLRRW